MGVYPASLTFSQKAMQYFVRGIDVSRYQDKIDWEKVASDEVDYAFIRLGIRGYTEGEILEVRSSLLRSLLRAFVLVTASTSITTGYVTL